MTGIPDPKRSKSGICGPAGRDATGKLAAAAGPGLEPSPGLVRHRGRHARFLLLALLPPIALTQAVWTEGGLMREGLEWLGYLAVIICVLGRAWCSAYIAGRKNRELVSCGPYSTVRNPLYAFSMAGLTGIGLQTGSLTWAALLLIGGGFYYRFVVRREESHLLRAFPIAYARYLATTPRWLPDPHLWRDVGQTTIRPALIGRTLLDGACYFAAYPLFEALADAHTAGLLPGLLSLP
jgi:protein-S-isoprenylcysteine O-methyltransferase Ste14